MIVRVLIAMACICCMPAQAYEAVPKRPVDLSGRWTLNAAASDDAEGLLDERLEKERKRYQRWAREMQAARPPGAQRVEDLDAPPPGPSARMQRRRERQQQLLQQMLNLSPTLDIEQQLPRFALTSAVDSRRYEAGIRTQVSMPEGELADCETGWDGEWFVIERRVRGGPGVVEKLRLIKKTGQLEYYMHWFGDTEISGLKVRRVFDRTDKAEAANR